MRVTPIAKPLSKLLVFCAEIRGQIAAARVSAPAAIRHALQKETQWLWVILPLAVISVYVYVVTLPQWAGSDGVLGFQPWIPLGSVFAAWCQRYEISEMYAELAFVYPDDSPKRRGRSWVVVLGCLLLMVATFSALATPAVVGLIVLIIGSVYVLYGPLITLALWRPLLFLVLMIPPPVTLVLMLSRHVQNGTAFLAGQLLHLVFHNALTMGTMISLPGFLLDVSPESGGLGVLLPVLCLTLVFVMFRQITVNVAVIIVMIAAVISVFLNVLRVVAIGLLSSFNTDIAAAWLGGSPVLITLLAFYLTYIAVNAVLRPQRRLSEFEQDLMMSTQYAESNADGNGSPGI